MVMRTAKISWVLFVLAFGFVGCTKAQDKKVVYKGKTVEQWIADLKDKDWNVRFWAAEALGDIGPKAEKAVPALIQAFNDKESMVRQYAAIALGKIGPKAAKAVPALSQASMDKHLLIRQFAREAIEKIQNVPGECPR
jgi:HEAT repeat protein